MKNKKARHWREIAYHYSQNVDHWKDMVERRGEMLSRVWMHVNAMVDDEELANSLRLAIVGDFIPDQWTTEEVADDDE